MTLDETGFSEADVNINSISASMLELFENLCRRIFYYLMFFEHKTKETR